MPPQSLTLAQALQLAVKFLGRKFNLVNHINKTYNYVKIAHSNGDILWRCLSQVWLF
jgi:hypothetical protein